MEVLRAVLDFEQPHTWERRPAESYTNSYLLFEIDRNESEWARVIQDITFDSESILSIRRVQNPVQMGLFKIQEEKRRNDYSSVNTTTGYHVIHSDDLNTAMKYTLDYRRYTHKNTSIQCTWEKHPKFFSTFGTALESGRSLSDSDGEFLIIQTDYFVNTKNQGDYYPKYVIRVKA